jgi:hypothetical protein
MEKQSFTLKIIQKDNATLIQTGGICNDEFLVKNFTRLLENQKKYIPVFFDVIQNITLGEAENLKVKTNRIANELKNIIENPNKN